MMPPTFLALYHIEKGSYLFGERLCESCDFKNPCHGHPQILAGVNSTKHFRGQLNFFPIQLNYCYSCSNMWLI